MRDEQYGKSNRKPMPPNRIAELQAMANDATGLVDGMQDLISEVDHLRQILGNVEFYLRRSGLSQQCAPALLEQLEAFRI